MAPLVALKLQLACQCSALNDIWHNPFFLKARDENVWTWRISRMHTLCGRHALVQRMSRVFKKQTIYTWCKCFLNRHIFCSMQPTIPMCNTLPSTKPTLAKTGFPHINAHHTNIVGWEKGSKRDIPERKTTLPKGKNTHSQNCLLQWKVKLEGVRTKEKTGSNIWTTC